MLQSWDLDDGDAERWVCEVGDVLELVVLDVGERHAFVWRDADGRLLLVPEVGEA